MYKPSAALVAAMKTKPYLARIKLDNGAVIESNPQYPDDPVKEIVFRGGTTGSEDGFVLGGTPSSTVVLSLNKDKVNCSFKDREIRVELGMDLGSAVEWIPMGTYYVIQSLGDDDQLSVEACDALYAKFEREYEPLAGFVFGSEEVVQSVAFLRALCARRGVTVDVSNLYSIPLVAAPDGFTERQIIGFIAALYGGFAVMDRNSVLRIRRYTSCDTHVTPDEYYDGGLEKAEYTFQAKWIKCYNSAADLTMIIGDTAAQQGIYMESIWMTHARLDDLWSDLKDFSYAPVSECSFFGNPLLDAGDIVTLTDLAGETMSVPIMKISHEYDGGVITQIAANGQQEAETLAGSVQNQLRRTAAQAKRYTDKETGKLDQLELLKRLTREWVDDALYLTAQAKLGIKATAIVTGVLDAALVTIKNLIADVITTGILRSADGKTYFDLDRGEIVASAGKVGAWKINDSGALTTSDENEYGEVENAVYMLPDVLYFMYDQSAGDGVSTSWDAVIKAGNAVRDGISKTVTVNGTTLTFENGVLSSVQVDA